MSILNVLMRGTRVCLSGLALVATVTTGCGGNATTGRSATGDSTGVTAGAATLPVPNYDVDLSRVVTVVDANNIVQPSSAGQVLLRAAPAQFQAGEEYVVTTQRVANLPFADVDSAYRQGTKRPIGQAPYSIDLGELGLVGQALPQLRTLIVKHGDANGMYTYQVAPLTFPGPLQ